MSKRRGQSLYTGHGFAELDAAGWKDFDRRLARKIPHNDSLAVDGVRGIGHQVPEPSKTFLVGADFDEPAYAKLTMKLLKRLRLAAPHVIVAKTFSNAFKLDLEAWDGVWPQEVHSPGFAIDALYIVDAGFSFGIVSDPFNRKIHYFGKPLLKLLAEVRELRPPFYT